MASSYYANITIAAFVGVVRTRWDGARIVQAGARALRLVYTQVIEPNFAAGSAAICSKKARLESYEA
jgi:hypothetical protein